MSIDGLFFLSVDLSPFTKFDVRGPDALALLQPLCTNEIDVNPDRSVYTLMLNPRGGIEADVTVTRTGERAFRGYDGGGAPASTVRTIIPAQPVPADAGSGNPYGPDRTRMRMQAGDRRELRVADARPYARPCVQSGSPAAIHSS